MSNDLLCIWFELMLYFTSLSTLLSVQHYSYQCVIVFVLISHRLSRLFSEVPYNDTSYNTTDPYVGESLPVGQSYFLSTLVASFHHNIAGIVTC